MTARILQGDVFDRLPEIAPGSVDCVVTSPPYFQLRDYGTGTWEGGNDPACTHGVASRMKKRPELTGGGCASWSTRDATVTQYRGTCRKCGARRIDKQLGLEPTPAAYVEAMVRVFRLVRECMAPHAVCWLNVGDTFSTRGGRGEARMVELGNPSIAALQRPEVRGDAPGTKGGNIPVGNLCLIPQRLAIALQDDGWIVRSVIVFHKPAPMPGSMAGWRWARCRVKVKAQGAVKNHARSAHGGNPSPPHPDNGIQRDAAQWAPCPGCRRCEPTGGLVLRRGSWRPTSAWEPLLMLAKGPRYFSDGEACKTPVAKWWNPETNGVVGRKGLAEEDGGQSRSGEGPGRGDPSAGANLRDVWTIAAEPLSCGLCPACGLFLERAPKYCPRCKEELGKHYASFSTELVYRCLAAGTSQRGYCPACSAPWARVVEQGGVRASDGRDQYGAYAGRRSRGEIGGPQHQSGQGGTAAMPRYEQTTLAWRPTCTCPGDLPPRPGLVLDPFAGSARVGLQCQRMGLDFVGVELSPEYVALGRRLLTDAAPLFAEE